MLRKISILIEVVRRTPNKVSETDKFLASLKKWEFNSNDWQIANKFLSFYLFADFNGDGKPDNITFMIKRIKVHTTNALKDPAYRFPGNYGVEKFLELFSGKCCIAYAFITHLHHATLSIYQWELVDRL